MKANELRIGNYLNIYESAKKDLWDSCEVFDEHKYFEVCKIFTDEINIYYDGSEYEFDYKEIEPIELTEEWLIKFGFTDIEDRLYCKRWRLDRVDVYKMISGNYPFYFRFNQVDSIIKYVHQLQNLYFALTGKELEI